MFASRSLANGSTKRIDELDGKSTRDGLLPRTTTNRVDARRLTSICIASLAHFMVASLPLSRAPAVLVVR
jgi:hypothetical protein